MKSSLAEGHARDVAAATLYVVALTLLPPGHANAQTVPSPVVTPSLPSDVDASVPMDPRTGAPFPAFDDFSWRSFVALNWPARQSPGDRGKADAAKAFGDAAGPRVWSTWKSRFEIFQPQGAVPTAWTSYAGANPCGSGVSNDVPTLSSFTAFADFNQALPA